MIEDTMTEEGKIIINKFSNSGIDHQSPLREVYKEEEEVDHHQVAEMTDSTIDSHIIVITEIIHPEVIMDIMDVMSAETLEKEEEVLLTVTEEIMMSSAMEAHRTLISCSMIEKEIEEIEEIEKEDHLEKEEEMVALEEVHQETEVDSEMAETSEKEMMRNKES